MKFKVFNCKIHKRKLIMCVMLLFFAITSLFLDTICVSAASDENIEYNKILNQSIESIISGLEFDELDNVVNELEDFSIFNTSIKDKIKSVLNGEYFTNYSSIFSGVLSIIFVDFREYIPIILTIIAIGILSNLFSELRSNNNSTSDIIHFVCMSIITLVIIHTFNDILGVVSKTLSSILTQTQLVFPILISMLTAIGSFASVSIYNPLVAVITTIISFVFQKLLYPIFIVIFVLTILGNLTTTVKLNKLQGFISSTFKWIVGIVFTLFTGFLSIQGISAGRYDSISIKATKFAIKSYIPIIGSYISDGMDFFVLGSILIKNTVGLVGVLVLFITIISPVISIVVLKLSLQFSSGVLEMCGSNKIGNFVGSISKLLIYPIILVFGVAFMYVITIILIMCTANIL